MKLTKEQLLFTAKGFAMGMADIVPGVSGGTVALITGVYDKLIHSISSVDKAFVSKIIKFEIREAVNQLNPGFLFPLFFGIILAIVSMSKIMHYFMTNFAVYTWSIFFGLILASILFIGKGIENIKAPQNLTSILFGTTIGHLIVSLIPVNTPDSYFMIFLSGCIGICAMILPGVSGSFILLILGKYLFITSALKNPLNVESITTILIFCTGCLVGILSFSKVLNFLLKKYKNLTMCVLTGFMIGSIKKIWPWREVTESKIIRGKTKILQDQAFFPSDFSTEVIIAFSLMIFGIILILLLEKMSKKNN